MIKAINRVISKILGIEPETIIWQQIENAKQQRQKFLVLTPESMNVSVESFNKGILWLSLYKAVDYTVIGKGKVLVTF